MARRSSGEPRTTLRISLLDMPGDLGTYIVPRHPCCFNHTESVADVVLDVLEVHDTRVIVVLAREQRALEVCRMHIGKWVGVGVPAPEAEVEPADGGVVVVDYNDLDR